MFTGYDFMVRLAWRGGSEVGICGTVCGCVGLGGVDVWVRWCAGMPAIDKRMRLTYGRFLMYLSNRRFNNSSLLMVESRGFVYATCFTQKRLARA